MKRLCLRPRPAVTQHLAWLLVALLGACSWVGGRTLPSPSPAISEPHLSASLLEQVLQAAGPHRAVDAPREYVQLTCSVFETSECWFGDTYLESPLAEALGEQVINELGRDFVANGEFNQVRLRCSRPTGGGATTCDVDLGRGFGWEPLPVEL